MTVHLVTFSDESMSRSRELCKTSAVRNGVEAYFDSNQEWLRQSGFYQQNQALLDNPRGCGLWAWKPWVISKAFELNEDGEYVVYSDAGVEFIDNVSHIIDRMDQDIFLFGNNWEHAHWCKRDVIEAIWYDRIETHGGEAGGHYNLWRHFGKQVQASVIFFRVSDHTRAFVAEWLKWCLFEGGRLIDDSPSRLPNHPEFQEHRHDQAILTTMAYREGIKLHYWPATYNDGAFNYEKLPCYAGDDYPVLFHHHRRRNHEWSNAA